MDLVDSRGIGEIMNVLSVSHIQVLGKMEGLNDTLQTCIGLKLPVEEWRECVRLDGSGNGLKIHNLTGRITNLTTRVNADERKLNGIDFSLLIRTNTTEGPLRGLYLQHVAHPILAGQVPQEIENITEFASLMLPLKEPKKTKEPKKLDKGSDEINKAQLGTWDSLVKVVTAKDNDPITTTALKILAIVLMVLLFPLTIFTYLASPMIDSCRGINVIVVKEGEGAQAL